jgi:hypothetical protein
MQNLRFVFTHAPGHHFKTRAVGFIEEQTRNELDAKRAYESLRPKVRNLVDSRFKHWLDRQRFDKYFHQFDGANRDCFTFKWEDRHVPQRLYGFLLHPKPKSLEFELCVLMYFDTKTDKTNYTILGWINQLSGHPMVRMAIAQHYPDLITKESTWIQ